MAQVNVGPEMEWLLDVDLAPPLTGGVKVTDHLSPFFGREGWIVKRDTRRIRETWQYTVTLGSDREQLLHEQLAKSTAVCKAERVTLA